MVNSNARIRNQFNTGEEVMKKLIFITVLFFTITACSSSSNLSGLYQCKNGPYKSLEFNDGKVILDAGIMKSQGTYEVNGHNVTLFINGESLVLKSIDVDKGKIQAKADDFILLDSQITQCVNDAFLKKNMR